MQLQIPSEVQKFHGEPQADRETHPLETSWLLPLFSKLILTHSPISFTRAEDAQPNNQPARGDQGKGRAG